MKVHVGSLNPVKINAVRRMFERVFPNEPLEVSGVNVASGVPEQPMGSETLHGAVNRARAAIGDGDFGVGIEAGLIEHEEFGLNLGVQFCAVLDTSGKLTTGHGPGFMYPPGILAEVERGSSVGESMAKLTGNELIGQQGGAIESLTLGLLNRTELTEQAVLMALIPRIRSELYGE